MKSISKLHRIISATMILSVAGIDAFAQNVGVGTSTPAEKLHIIGSVRSSTLSGAGNREVLADPNGTLIIGTTTNAPDWTILGNTGTNPATNFLGTIDAQDFVIRRANIERFRLTSTGAVFNENSLNYDFRIESNNNANVFVVDGANDRIGFGTAAPANWIHTRRTTVAAFWDSYWENTSTSGAPLQGENTNAANGARVIMGVTNYNANALEASAIIGLHINSLGTGGVGVRGITNGTDALGCYGSKNPGGLGWGGLMVNDMGYTGFHGFASDRSIKKNIQPITDALTKVQQLQGRTFEYRDDVPSPMKGYAGTHTGFIAQELEQVFPEMVKEKLWPTESHYEISGGMVQEKKDIQLKSVDIIPLIPVLVEAIKEQQKLIEELRKRIEALEN